MCFLFLGDAGVPRALLCTCALLSNSPSLAGFGSQVYCGNVGGEQRKEYSVLGNGVNLAARLMVWRPATLATPLQPFAHSHLCFLLSSTVHRAPTCICLMRSLSVPLSLSSLADPRSSEHAAAVHHPVFLRGAPRGKKQREVCIRRAPEAPPSGTFLKPGAFGSEPPPDPCRPVLYQPRF